MRKKKEFSSCSQSEMCKFQKNEDKANAHADTPFRGVFQFAMPTIKVGLWSYDQGQQPLGGVGRLRLSFLGIAQPRFGKCNDSRLFCLLRNWRCSLQNWANSIEFLSGSLP